MCLTLSRHQTRSRICGFPRMCGLHLLQKRNLMQCCKQGSKRFLQQLLQARLAALRLQQHTDRCLRLRQGSKCRHQPPPWPWLCLEQLQLARGIRIPNDLDAFPTIWFMRRHGSSNHELPAAGVNHKLMGEALPRTLSGLLASLDAVGCCCAILISPRPQIPAQAYLKEPNKRPELRPSCKAKLPAPCPC